MREAIKPIGEFLLRLSAVGCTVLGGINMITSVITAHGAAPDHASSIANGPFIAQVVGIVVVALCLIKVVCKPYM